MASSARFDAKSQEPPQTPITWAVAASMGEPDGLRDVRSVFFASWDLITIRGCPEGAPGQFWAPGIHGGKDECLLTRICGRGISSRSVVRSTGLKRARRGYRSSGRDCAASQGGIAVTEPQNRRDNH